MYPIIVIIAAAVVTLGGCIQPCPSERVWTLDPYMYEAGIMAPLVVSPGDFSDSSLFKNDKEFADMMGITVEELKKKLVEPRAEPDDTKGTI